MPDAAPAPVEYRWLGELPYPEALALQHELRKRALEGGPGALLLLTHPHTVTVGRHGNEAHILRPELLLHAGCHVQRVDRGGDVTYHGPGQLVGYPIVHLGLLRLSVSAYMQRLGEVLADAAADFGVHAVWEPRNPGLFVGRDKLAAFGAHVHRGVTTHGFAFNVAPDLRFYDLIVPCGLRDRGVTSLAALLGAAAPPLDDVRDRVLEHFRRRFGVELLAA